VAQHEPNREAVEAAKGDFPVDAAALDPGVSFTTGGSVRPGAALGERRHAILVRLGAVVVVLGYVRRLLGHAPRGEEGERAEAEVASWWPWKSPNRSRGCVAVRGDVGQGRMRRRRSVVAELGGARRSNLDCECRISRSDREVRLRTVKVE
jgi:hypothetical protein